MNTRRRLVLFNRRKKVDNMDLPQLDRAC